MTPSLIPIPTRSDTLICGPVVRGVSPYASVPQHDGNPCDPLLVSLSPNYPNALNALARCKACCFFSSFQAYTHC